MSQTVLVVDDDKSIVELMRDFLENDGFQVLSAHNAIEAFEILKNKSVNCLILDIMMPGQSGFDLCRQIRIANDVPILFLSARDDDMNKIRGLGLGGDDYIVKTASPAEVVARVKAVLRRSGNQKEGRMVTMNYKGLKINLSAREVQVNQQKIALTPREYDLLCLFAEHPRQVFTYEHLLEAFWNGVGDKHTVRVHVSRIREKIEADPNNPQYIVNVWGVGYRFEGISS
jgi:DNA-binding response OmpR family regulator